MEITALNQVVSRHMGKMSGIRSKHLIITISDSLLDSEEDIASKTFWKFIKSITRHYGHRTLIHCEKAETPLDKANMFNDQSTEFL